MKLLTARIEYPYRVRRRTSDDPAVLTALADQGHRLQEQLAATQAWIVTESTVVGDVFAQSLACLDGPFKQACRQAWQSPPVSSAAEMNLNGFGMGDQQHLVDGVERAAAYRFGLRRLIPAVILRRLLN